MAWATERIQSHLAFDFLRDVVHGVVAAAYLLSVLQEGHNVGGSQHQELAPDSLLRLGKEGGEEKEGGLQNSQRVGMEIFKEKKG